MLEHFSNSTISILDFSKQLDLSTKIIAGLERLSEVYKTLLWEKAKEHGISPIQIQILLFVAEHKNELANVSYLAKELLVTKPTISDAVRVLLKKDLLEKDFSPTDSRRYNLLLSTAGQHLVQDLVTYNKSIATALQSLDTSQQKTLFESLSTLIYQLHQQNVIQVQRSCFNCKHYAGDKAQQHFCNLLQQPLLGQDLRLDCPEFEVR